MTDYYNQSTGRWESPEEMGERPATAETVLASDVQWEISWDKACEAVESWSTAILDGRKFINPPDIKVEFMTEAQFRTLVDQGLMMEIRPHPPGG